MSQATPTDEVALLRGTLDNQRLHVLGILEGLGEEDLRRPVLPSGWSCAGLVQHLVLDVEHWWFWRVVAGRPPDRGEDIEDAWQLEGDITAAAVLDLYRTETERSNAIVAETPLEAAPAWWPEELFGTWRLHSLRQVLLHVIAETACHAGHLDAARELIDGRTWLVLG